jgi:hypothetical protein
MKRRLGYSMREAEKEFFDSCDGTNVLHLIEVFGRPNGYDGEWMNVTRRVNDVPDAGELWMADEDGYDFIVNDGWDYEARECVGFDRDELREMKEAGEI